MLPRHGGVPTFSPKISGPMRLLLISVLVIGTLVTLTLSFGVDEGDASGQARVRLCILVTLLLSVLILIAGTARLWHRHLWEGGGSSQRAHRQRLGKSRHHSRRHHRSHRR